MKRECRITIRSLEARGISQTFFFEREEFCEGYPVYSSLMVCPICKSIWAEIEISGRNVFQPRMVSCEDCNWQGTAGHEWLNPVPGSLLDNDRVGGIDWPMLADLPESLVTRELHLTLQAFEKCPAAFDLEEC